MVGGWGWGGQYTHEPGAFSFPHGVGVLTETRKPELAADSSKSKSTSLLTPVRPELPNRLQTLRNAAERCSCGAQDKLSVDYFQTLPFGVDTRNGQTAGQA